MNNAKMPGFVLVLCAGRHNTAEHNMDTVSVNSTTQSTSTTCTHKFRRVASRSVKTDPQDTCMWHWLQNNLNGKTAIMTTRQSTASLFYKKHYTIIIDYMHARS